MKGRMEFDRKPMRSGIMIADNVLIDTSVWIEYFRDKSPLKDIEKAIGLDLNTIE